MVMSARPYIMNYRHFTRHGYTSRILVLPAGGDEYIEAAGIEYSRGGVRFEADTYLVPNTQVDLKHFDPLPNLTGYENIFTEMIPAQVKWCSRLDQASTLLYRVGARFMIESCDWCDNVMPCRRTRVDGDRLMLCQSCLADLERMNEGRLKETVRQRLLGNVL